MNPDTRVCRRCIDAVEFWGVGQRPLALTAYSRHFWDVSETRPLRGWWQEADIDPVKAARKLWSYSRMDQGRVHRCQGNAGTWATTARDSCRRRIVGKCTELLIIQSRMAQSIRFRSAR
jgi:hypothetical protein